VDDGALYRELASGLSTVVEHSTPNPEIEGLNPSTGTGREKRQKYQLLTHIYIGYLKNLLGPNNLAYFAAATVTKKKIFVTLISGQKCWTTVLAATSIEQVNIVTHSIDLPGPNCNL
jgi:hypothetical protein